MKCGSEVNKFNVSTEALTEVGTAGHSKNLLKSYNNIIKGTIWTRPALHELRRHGPAVYSEGFKSVT